MEHDTTSQVASVATADVEGTTTASTAPPAPVALPVVRRRIEVAPPHRTVDDRPLARLAPAAPYPAGGVVRRTLWTYDGAAWRNGLDQVGIPQNLPPGQVFATNDAFDDASGTLTNGRNGEVKGEPGRFVGYDAASDQDTQRVRKGLGFAKLKVQRALTQLAAEQAAAALPGGAYSAQLQQIVETAFNGKPNAQLVTMFVAGLQRVLNGLDSADLELVVATKMRLYGRSEDADCSGWVPRGVTEMGSRGTGATSIADLEATSRPIHLNPRFFNNTNFLGDVIVHEAMHRFLGVFDLSYIGTPGTVETGLQTKVGAKQQADPNLSAADARIETKRESGARAHAQLVQALVAEAATSAGLSVPQRAAPVLPTDPAAVAAIKRAWQVVRLWGVPNAPVPLIPDLRKEVVGFTTAAGMPSGLVSKLKSYLEDAHSFLSENGNELGVKGHDVLFALPTPYLLKNADSWTELAIQLA